MKFTRLALLVIVALMVVSCKIRIVVPEGGKVVSASGDYKCKARKTCTIDVIDIFFNETFIAKPAKGYEFTSWKKWAKKAGFCGGQKKRCRLSTSGFDAFPELMSILEGDDVYYLSPKFLKSSDNEEPVFETRAGFMHSEITNFAGSMPITVWYPTSVQLTGLSEPADEPSEYLFPMSPDVNLPVPTQALRDAPIEAGTFPLILTFPSGGTIETGFIYFPNAELLAAEGYIVVTPGRNSVEGDAQGPLLSGLIDHMLDEHPLRDSIDDKKIGAKGLAAGGFGTLSLAAGDVFGNAPDGRVRGLIIDENENGCAEFANCEPVTIPVMLRDGSPNANSGDMTAHFAALKNAFPRFLVSLENVSHFGFVTGDCEAVEAGRQGSLAYQQDVLGEILEPEPRKLSYFFTAQSNGDLLGSLTSFAWNQDFFQDNDGTYGSSGDTCEPEYGGPVTLPPGQVLLDPQTMIETLHTLDLGFWETVFGDGNSETTALEEAVNTLNTVKSFVKES